MTSKYTLKSLFPFNPYPNQLKIVDDLYEKLGKQKIIIIESPTGTGKTICLIIPIFKWY